MARAKYISPFERDIMRIGHSRGINAPTIARFLGRGKLVVYRHLQLMRDEGTLDDLPLCFVCDEIAEAIRKADGSES